LALFAAPDHPCALHVTAWGAFPFFQRQGRHITFNNGAHHDHSHEFPFSFDAAQLAEAYPNLRKPMLVFEKVFDKLLKANEHIDGLIMGMVPAAAKTAE